MEYIIALRNDQRGYILTLRVNESMWQSCSYQNLRHDIIRRKTIEIIFYSPAIFQNVRTGAELRTYPKYIL